jgi:Fe2+ transport system protein FeoA
MIETKTKNKDVLSNVSIGKKVKISEFKNDTETKLFLMSLGVLPGDEIEVISRAPFGDPIFLKHFDTNFFAIRKNQAKFIEVEL